MSHGPCKGYLDQGLGCPSMLKCLQKVQPKIFSCGHIHAAHGETKGKDKDNTGNITFVNAANCLGDHYLVKFEPIVINLDDEYNVIEKKEEKQEK